MNLALFDLDHTLIPFDSGMAWTRYLVGIGALPPEAEATYLAYAHDYVAGTLDIHAMHRASMQPLVAVPRARIREWTAGFKAEMASRLPPEMLALVRRHQADGDLCAIVTATTRLVCAPLAELFDLPLIATETETAGPGADAPYTGEIAGEACFRAHKVDRVHAWLAGQGRHLADFERAHFYSDSFSDLPLLQAVTDPVAVAPDPRLRAHAAAHGWTVIERPSGAC